MTPLWVRTLIGIPFLEHGRSLAGCDCWGLVRLALARGFEIAVPDYSEGYVTTTDREELHALITGEARSWLPVPIAEAQPGDVVLFRMQGQVCHAGLVLEPPTFVHCQKGIGTALEDWTRPLWQRRIDSVVRHPALVGEASC